MLKHFRLAILGSIAVAAAAVFLRIEASRLPAIPAVKFWEPALKSKLFDRKGRLIFEYAVEKRDYVPFHLIPAGVRQAYIAIEDDRFYRHWGIDLHAIFRAFTVNLMKGRAAQGGSTITQQVARNLYLNREKTFRRKFGEQLLAVYMERVLSKDEILELYLNRAYLGHGVYGVGEGSKAFFGKPLEEITLPEAAILAGLVQRPSATSPWERPQSAKFRGKVVLRRMFELNMISSSAFAGASVDDVMITSRTPTVLPPAFAHFIEYVRQDVEERYSPEILWKGGLKIETTIDMDYQAKTFEAVSQALERFDTSRADWEKAQGNVAYSTSSSKIETAFLALEAKTGKALVWIGGRDFKISQLNRVYQSDRPPGSAFKPFVWLAAFMAGASPSTVYDDLPLAYTYDGRSWRLVPGSTDFYQILQATSTLTEDMVWIPENFDGKYYGPISLRRALAASRNLISVRLVDKVGPVPIIDLARKAGIQSRMDRVLSLGLGTSVVTLLELVGAYQTLANLGVHAKPFAINKIIQNSTGEVLEENFPQLAETLPPAPVYALVDVMKSVVSEGTARAIGRRVKRPLAGKTGTTQDNRDLWFVGFTPEVVAGGWMGYDNNESIGKKDVTGGSSVGPWWAESMAYILKDYEPRDFGAPPEGISFHKVCVVSGKLARASCAQTRLELFLKESALEYCKLESHETQVFSRPDVILAPGATTQSVVDSTATVTPPQEDHHDPTTSEHEDEH